MEGDWQVGIGCGQCCSAIDVCKVASSFCKVEQQQVKPKRHSRPEDPVPSSTVTRCSVTVSEAVLLFP